VSLLPPWRYPVGLGPSSKETKTTNSSVRFVSPFTLLSARPDPRPQVKWDEHSLFVRGERILFYSGEFHPFRLPVPSLWLDIFQKIKALGYSAVSFYVDWALLEGQPGHFRADGIFSLDPFFDAAS
jgi:Glycosyl hydrolases family 35